MKGSAMKLSASMIGKLEQLAGHRRTQSARMTWATVDALVSKGLAKMVRQDDGTKLPEITKAGLAWLAANLPAPVLLCRVHRACTIEAFGTTMIEGRGEVRSCEQHHHGLTGEWRQHCTRCGVPVRNVDQRSEDGKPNGSAWVRAGADYSSDIWRCQSGFEPDAKLGWFAKPNHTIDPIS